MTSTTTLPDKLGALIRVAIADLEKVEAMPDKYAVDFGVWHEPRDEGVCAVDLPGAVMAITLNSDASESLEPFNFNHEIGAKLIQLTALQRGNVASAHRPGSKHGLHDLDCDVTPYHRDPASFKRDMLALADRLDAAGL